MSPSPRTTKNKDRPWNHLGEKFTDFTLCDSNSGKEHSMRALSKAFLLSLIQNEDSLTCILNRHPCLGANGEDKQPASPPLTAISYEVAVSVQRLKAQRAQKPQDVPSPSVKELTQLHNFQTQQERCEIRSLRWYASAYFFSLVWTNSPLPAAPIQLFGFTLKERC